MAESTGNQRIISWHKKWEQEAITDRKEKKNNKKKQLHYSECKRFRVAQRAAQGTHKHTHNDTHTHP
jgi:hypothetical protein